MTRRGVWITAFLSVTSIAFGMELWAANDNDPDTVPWTHLIADNIPAAVTFAAVAALVVWLPAHFRHAYKTGDSSMKYAKAWMAGAAALLAVATAVAPFVPPNVKPWVEVIISVLGAVAVRQVPNQPAEGV